ncbi:MAG: class I SAM-dependent methyltransferase [Vicinamibacterales bacterium]
MNAEVYEAEAALHGTHWWFVGRRELFSDLLQELGPRPQWRVLEVGTGTGANLPVLDALGVRQVVGCDVSAEALRYSARGHAGPLAAADAARLPFKDSSFDLVMAADVIEHLDDDCAALAEFVRILKPGGHFILTVPAFPALWGPQDVVAHHRRRYRRQAFLELVSSARLKVRSCFYFNYVLFVPIWAARKLLLALGIPVRTENAINTALINRVLTQLFRADVKFARRLRVPFGVSLCAVGVKTA